jgi:hypothetical protein
MFILAISGAVATSVAQAQEVGEGIVASIGKAPVVSNGDVSGELPELVVNLDVSMDPAVPGRALLLGKTIKIILPSGMVDTGAVPAQTPFTPDCAPPLLNVTWRCNTVFVLQGWPQHPVGFPPPNIPNTYAVSSDGPNTLVVTALKDLIPNPPLEPGIKQLHLLLAGYVVPRPGVYEVQVVAETGLNGAVETGSGLFHVRPKPKPSINVTSVFNPGSPNTIYQKTAPGAFTPLNYDFLLWDGQGMPMTGVEIADGQLVRTGIPVRRGGHDALRRTDTGNRTVGQVWIEAPAGAVGQEIFSTGPSVPALSPAVSVPTARLTARFRAGSLPGDYTVTFHMAGGNTVEMFVKVE